MGEPKRMQLGLYIEDEAGNMTKVGFRARWTKNAEKYLQQHFGLNAKREVLVGLATQVHSELMPTLQRLLKKVGLLEESACEHNSIESSESVLETPTHMHLLQHKCTACHEIVLVRTVGCNCVDKPLKLDNPT